jgi:hypothetical protein
MFLFLSPFLLLALTTEAGYNWLDVWLEWFCVVNYCNSLVLCSSHKAMGVSSDSATNLLQRQLSCNWCTPHGTKNLIQYGIWIVTLLAVVKVSYVLVTSKVVNYVEIRIILLRMLSSNIYVYFFRTEIITPGIREPGTPVTPRRTPARFGLWGPDVTVTCLTIRIDCCFCGI